MKRSACRQVVVAALAFIACMDESHAATGPETPSAGSSSALLSYGEALTQWRDGNFARAEHLFRRLAESGDKRAQVLLSTFLVDGHRIVRNLPEAYAWAVIATTDYSSTFGRSAMPMATLWKSTLDEQLTGPDILKGERIAREFLAERQGEYSRNLQAAQAFFEHGGPAPSLPLRLGCAMDADQPRCREARESLGETPRCRGTFPTPDVAPSLPKEEELRKPAYPSLARWRAWEGTTGVLVQVDRSGYACRVAIVKSSGYPMIDESVLDAASAWHYTAARKGGEPVESTHSVFATHVITDFQVPERVK